MVFHDLSVYAYWPVTELEWRAGFLDSLRPGLYFDSHWRWSQPPNFRKVGTWPLFLGPTVLNWGIFEL